MKKWILLGIVVMMVSSVLTSVTPAMAQDLGFTKITAGFNISEASGGFKIPTASTVRHRADGITEVFGPDRSLMLKSKDSDTELVSSPQGPTKATNAYQVPSGSLVDNQGGVVKIYKGDELILTIIDERPKKDASLAIPPAGYGNDWVEDAYDTGVRADYNYAEWTVPNGPPQPYVNTVNYIFNAMQPGNGSSIILPVLAGYNSQTWNGSAHYVQPGVIWVYTSPINVNVNDRIVGLMQYQGSQRWLIYFYDMTTAQSTYLNAQQTNFGSETGFFGPDVFWTLEAYETYADGQICGPTTFSSIYLSRNGNPLTIHLKKKINTQYFPSLTNLDVTWVGQSSITLHTGTP